MTEISTKFLISFIKMKQKISISIEEEKIKIIEELLKDGLFRNKSHVIEYSLDRFLEQQKNMRESKHDQIL